METIHGYIQKSSPNIWEQKVPDTKIYDYVMMIDQCIGSIIITREILKTGNQKNRKETERKTCLAKLDSADERIG